MKSSFFGNRNSKRANGPGGNDVRGAAVAEIKRTHFDSLRSVHDREKFRVEHGGTLLIVPEIPTHVFVLPQDRLSIWKIPQPTFWLFNAGADSDRPEMGALIALSFENYKIVGYDKLEVSIIDPLYDALVVIYLSPQEVDDHIRQAHRNVLSLKVFDVLPPEAIQAVDADRKLKNLLNVNGTQTQSVYTKFIEDYYD